MTRTTCATPSARDKPTRRWPERHAAETAPEKSGQFDHALFTVDFGLQKSGIGLRKIGRAAKHRHRECRAFRARFLGFVKKFAGSSSRKPT